MPDTDSDQIEDLKEKIDDLENDLESKTTGKNQIEMEAFDLSVKANSEEATMEELAEICSDEMDTLTKRALIGEYQELEEENLIGQLLGGDR